MAHAYSKNEHMPIVRPRLGVRAVGPPGRTHCVGSIHCMRSAVGRCPQPLKAAARSAAAYHMPSRLAAEAASALAAAA